MHVQGAADGADGGATADWAAHGGAVEADDALRSGCSAANRQPMIFVSLALADEAGPHPFTERRLSTQLAIEEPSTLFRYNDPLRPESYSRLFGHALIS
jgi:hypothetical protein